MVRKYKNKKGKKKMYKKRNRSRKSKWTQPANTIRLQGTRPFPDRYFCKLKFSYVYTATMSTTFNSLYIRGNGAQNPLTSTGDTYPIGFPQLADLYGAYRVYGAKIIFRVTNQTQNLEGQAHIVAANNSTGYTDILNIQNETYVKSAYVANEKPIKLKMYMATNKIVGKTKSIVANDSQYGAGVTGVPSELWYYKVILNSADFSSTVTMVGNITVIYYIQFDQRKSLLTTAI